MEKEFVKYNQALALKELGFDEPCFKGYTEEYKTLISFANTHTNTSVKNTLPTKPFTAPTYSAAFRWFREKHGLLHDITLTLNINDELESFYILIHKLNGLVMNEDDDIELNVKTTNKEEAESACLDKLIEICKNK